MRHFELIENESKIEPLSPIVKDYYIQYHSLYKDVLRSLELFLKDREISGDVIGRTFERFFIKYISQAQ